MIRYPVKKLLVAVLGLSLWLSPLTAAAQDVEQARTYFKAGAQAYEAGQFLAAIQAFEQAFKFAPRAGLVFSIAQAYRRQYYIDKAPQHLNEAINKYRAYLKAAPDGPRRADAAQALAELEPLAAKLQAPPPTGEDGEEGVPPPAPAPTPALTSATRLMVSSQTEGAKVSLDGGKPKKAPLIAEVKAGQHKVLITAKGYFDEEREVTAAEGGILAVDIRLRERPARLTLRVEEGSEVSIDGRLVGVAPLSPLDLPSGDHFISVVRNGREAWSRDIRLKRGEKRTLKVDLEVTTQRTVSWALIGTGIASVAIGALATLGALSEQQKAQDIDKARDTGNITPGDLDKYAEHAQTRDDLRIAAFGSYVAGALFATTGLFLYSFDEPKMKLPPPRLEQDTPEQEPASKPDEPSMEISAAPFWTPGAAGAAVGGRF